MSWTRKLPTVSGLWWFRDRDNTEQGVARVNATKRTATILIYPSDLDDSEYISEAYWLEHETTNPNWSWYGPIHQPN